MTVEQLVDTVADAAGKQIGIRWVDGPVGVKSRNFSNNRIESLGWKPEHSLNDGIARTYPWIQEQVQRVLAPAES